MADAGLMSMLARTAMSLTVVLGIIAVAYAIVKRRAGGGTRVARVNTESRKRTAAPPVNVVGRVGLTRGTVAVAVRFGDRVILVGANEQSPPTTLAEMPAAAWEEPQIVRDRLKLVESDDQVAVGMSPSTRPTVLEALRVATSRRP